MKKKNLTNKLFGNYNGHSKYYLESEASHSFCVPQPWMNPIMVSDTNFAQCSHAHLPTCIIHGYDLIISKKNKVENLDSKFSSL